MKTDQTVKSRAVSMPRTCCIINCKNRGWKTFNIPKGKHPFQQRRRKLWLAAINRPDWGPEGSCGRVREDVCSAHFISGQPSMDSDSPDFVPSVFNNSVRKSRRARKAEPKIKRRRKTSRATVPPEATQTTTHERDLVPRQQMDALILEYNQLFMKYEALERELRATREENKQLQEQLGRSNVGIDLVKDEEDSKVQLHTGLLIVKMEDI